MSHPSVNFVFACVRACVVSVDDFFCATLRVSVYVRVSHSNPGGPWPAARYSMLIALCLKIRMQRVTGVSSCPKSALLLAVQTNQRAFVTHTFSFSLSRFRSSLSSPEFKFRGTMSGAPTCRARNEISRRAGCYLAVIWALALRRAISRQYKRVSESSCLIRL